MFFLNLIVDANGDSLFFVDNFRIIKVCFVALLQTQNLPHLGDYYFIGFGFI